MLLLSVEEGHDLAAGAGGIRGEAISACAFGYAIADCPVDGIIAI